MTAHPLRLLLVDPDEEFLRSAARWLSDHGHAVATAGSASEALAQSQSRRFDAAVIELRLPDACGTDLLKTLKEADGPNVLVLTAHGTIEAAVEAMKLGASDFLVKPCRLTELERRCAAAVGVRFSDSRSRLDGGRLPDGELIGLSSPMRDLSRLISRVAASDRPVLIEGESGTGKELVAAAIYRASSRSRRPLVTINCAALPDPLLESEFFGHEKGAFTGAATAKQGLFEAADGGTLFIDEVGELASSLQAKLLRVLENGSFRRVGSVSERRADVRVIAATNRGLGAEVAAGRFREDLYYRLNVLTLRLPPLRDRDGDLPLLLETFMGPGWHLDGEACRAIEAYPWPGNIRQLRNAIERAKVLGSRGVVRLCDLPPEVASFTPPRLQTSAGDDIKVRERAHVLQVLCREGGNKSRAARALGVDRRSLYRMLERYEHDGFAVAGGASAG